MAPKISIIVLNWNRYDDTSECLSSLMNLTYPSSEIVLVDNGSSDGSGARLKQEYPDIHVIRNRSNLGFTGGNNAGIRHALENGADYVLLLNNDTVVAPDLLERLLEVVEEDEEAGIVGAVNYCYHNRSKIWASGAVIKNRWLFLRTDYTQGKTGIASLPAQRCVDYVPGSSMLIRRQVLDDIGLLDERYFAQFEETDFCLRAKRNGYKVISAAYAQVWHKVGRSGGASSYLNVDLSKYFYHRNRPLCIVRNLEKKYWLTCFVACYCSALFRILLDALHGRWTNACLILWGVRDFHLGKLGAGSLSEILNRFSNSDGAA